MSSHTKRTTPATAAQLIEALATLMKAPPSAPDTTEATEPTPGKDTLLGDMAALLPKRRPQPPRPPAAPAVVFTEAKANASPADLREGVAGTPTGGNAPHDPLLARMDALHEAIFAENKRLDPLNHYRALESRAAAINSQLVEANQSLNKLLTK